MNRPSALLLAALAVALAATHVRAGEEAASAGPTSDPTQVKPGRYVLDSTHGKITWSISHLGYSTFYGAITDVTAEAMLDPREPAKSTLKVEIATDSVNGLNEKLNAHLKAPDFFDTQKFPKATYVSTSIEPTSPTTARINGDLTIKGVTRVVSFDATFNQAGVNPIDKKYTVGFDGRALIRRSDFNVSAFLPAVGDEVSLRLEGEFKAADQK